LSPICGRPRSTPPSTAGRSWRCWSDGCARRGRAFVSCCGPTAAFAGRGSWPGANGTGSATILGLAKNPRLAALAEPWLADAKAGFAETGEKQRRFGEFRYAAKTWSAERRVIARVEHDRLGTNPRYVVTNLVGPPEALYKDLYCARGDMENRIKEQFELFADRTSCHKWWPNQFRLLLAGLAYSLLTAVRRLGLTGTELARAHPPRALEDRRRHLVQH
jgi:hypothetical protein